MFDLGIQLAIVLLFDIPRTTLSCLRNITALSTIEFNIPKHVLDIVYSQTICWMALFFAPLISFVTSIKLFAIFYLRMWFLRYLCTPTKSLYEVRRPIKMVQKTLRFSIKGFEDLCLPKLCPSDILWLLIRSTWLPDWSAHSIQCLRAFQKPR